MAAADRTGRNVPRWASSLKAVNVLPNRPSDSRPPCRRRRSSAMTGCSRRHRGSCPTILHLGGHGESACSSLLNLSNSHPAIHLFVVPPLSFHRSPTADLRSSRRRPLHPCRAWSYSVRDAHQCCKRPTSTPSAHLAADAAKERERRAPGVGLASNCPAYKEEYASRGDDLPPRK